MTTVCVVMPAYNEAEGIASFLGELNESLAGLAPSFVVVNDCSRDTTADVVARLASDGVPVTIHTNERNSGHGPSTLRAMRLGIESGSDVIVTTDGDGQFSGADIRMLIDRLVSDAADVVEGVRTARTDPAYRKISTTATCLLVWSRVRKFPADANTPMRVYRPSVLQGLIADIPVNAMTPNLFISMLSRKRGLRVKEIEVRALPRRGAASVGTTWGKGSLLPSKRFLGFCAGATREWFSTSIK